MATDGIQRAQRGHAFWTQIASGFEALEHTGSPIYAVLVRPVEPVPEFVVMKLTAEPWRVLASTICGPHNPLLQLSAIDDAGSGLMLVGEPTESEWRRFCEYAALAIQRLHRTNLEKESESSPFHASARDFMVGVNLWMAAVLAAASCAGPTVHDALVTTSGVVDAKTSGLPLDMTFVHLVPNVFAASAHVARWNTANWAEDVCDEERVAHSQSPTLTRNQQLVLRVMADADPSGLLTVESIRNSVPPLERPSEETTRVAVQRLLSLALAERPEGRNHGARLTGEGRILAGKLGKD